ncbi:MAG: hypothetical protein ACYC6N_12740 [Pirellulaceae bacterium]
MKTRVLVMAAVAVLSNLLEPAPGFGQDAAKTDWLFQARWGVMTHYLGAPPSSATRTLISLRPVGG